MYNTFRAKVYKYFRGVAQFGEIFRVLSGTDATRKIEWQQLGD